MTELTVALHYVFNTPDDRIVWDVGHQAYGHKILTGKCFFSFFFYKMKKSARERERRKREKEKKNSLFFLHF